ncbi:protein of unknown function [Taphrina deformans PYCC 5710]|uniref:ML-like domain-containing protein n=1 Tax=Taphrina deformans (strain PYCC 5710 / ATCC 11124 / CBS 356.35 / IMI 108563 / JCM 9778 / NBRC 8474) TaxID=1097556 RepID=R4XFQ9_TAPDE|nr:protein of unknown function [Taphrina deformans PYCC 5710]|eukprot:CCG84508.1 protein of unknown function [Taphrina deformans PYCC 5710]
MLNGTSSTKSFVKAQINITAYGLNAYSNTFDPCSANYNAPMLCPLQAGPYNATGVIVVPESILKDIPALAFQVPDLQGFVTMSLKSKDGDDLTCINAPVSNGQTLASNSVKTVSGTVAAGALLISGAVSMTASVSASTSAVGLGGAGGGGSGASAAISTSPNVGDVFLWFQAIGLNGAFSVAYPTICHSFYKNFGWSVGLVQWQWMQHKIDSFRQRTGGKVDIASADSSASDRSSNKPSKVSSVHARRKRSMSAANLQPRDDSSTKSKKLTGVINGLEDFAEQLRIPSQNTFMTILLVFTSIITTAAVLSVLLKMVLDLLQKSKRLSPFWQKFHAGYWSSVTGLVLRSILIIYGTWCLFCLYQLKNGDSWAASLLAGFSLAIFTGVISFLTIRILQIALHESAGIKGSDRLFKHKPYLKKYGILYDQFQSATWWFFIPCLLYSLLKSCIMALGDGHGMFQVIGCISCEIALLVCILATHAYDSKQANVVNTLICVVRIISLVGTLLFIDIFALKETTKTGAGIAIIILQSGTTLALTCLIILNGILPWLRSKSATSKTMSENAEEDTLPLEPNEAPQDGLPELPAPVYQENVEHTPRETNFLDARKHSCLSCQEYQLLHTTDVEEKVLPNESEDANAFTSLMAHRESDEPQKTSV